MTDLHEVQFRWPHSNASHVVVTGAFDGWSGSVYLAKTSSGFEGTARVPWGQKIAYKFIVDGRWTTADGQPTEFDSNGNLNNIYTSPNCPSQEETKVEASTIRGAVAAAGTAAGGAAVAMVGAIAPETTSQAPQAPTQSPEETSLPVVAPAPPDPSSAEADPAATPKPEAKSEPSPPELEPVTLSEEAVLPPEEVAAPHLAPNVPIHVLPLLPEVPVVAPGVTNTRQGVAQQENSDVISEPSTHVPAGMNGIGGRASSPATVSKPSETETSVVGTTAASEEEPVESVVLDPVVVSNSAVDAAPANGSPAELPSTSDTAAAPIPEKPIANGSSAPVTTASASAPETPAVNGSSAHTNGTTSKATLPSTPPAKEKRMRFPSLSVRSRRSSSSVHTSTTEFGADPGKEGTKSETLGGTHRKKRSSIFGKLKGIFDSPSKLGK
ncbi:uncharacterized protein FIBRA_01179 [Fibroporia radiculosa]|uniref:AMP-activated protein kinase glycogen-binding domain-containing protein n=1 Tax=Fibroporia radiculosa TaxID=599839 RepID=J4H0Y6_9APHY|nr:uncharacterized protein FIBRA_01179 [Fibroporia radiculosa]CCL99164.1 predicted protein [Fibroporia radiculosa]